MSTPGPVSSNCGKPLQAVMSEIPITASGTVPKASGVRTSTWYEPGGTEVTVCPWSFWIVNVQFIAYMKYNVGFGAAPLEDALPVVASIAARAKTAATVQRRRAKAVIG